MFPVYFLCLHHSPLSSAHFTDKEMQTEVQHLNIYRQTVRVLLALAFLNHSANGAFIHFC